MAFSFKHLFSSASKAADTGPRRVIGVDFGTSAVKVVEIELADRAPTLTTYGELQLGPYGGQAVGDVVTLTFEQKKEALVDLMRESLVKSREGVYAMSLNGSFVTTVALAERKGEDMNARVNAEARKYIPVPMVDVTLDWADISDDQSGGLRELLLVAIQNQVLAEQRELMDAIGMRAQPTEIESFSTLRSLVDDDAPVAIIDFGAETSKLYIARGQQLLRIHRVRAGGQLITKRLAQLYNIPFEDAELLKRSTSAQTPDADVLKTVQGVFDRPLQEFRRVIEQYETRLGKPLAAVFVTGGCARLTSLVALAREALQHDVALADPFGRVAYPPFLEDTLRQIGPHFAVAIGAAVRLAN